MKKDRIYLSPPNLDEGDISSVEESLRSGWIAPVGPQIDEFEEKLEELFEGKKVLVLNSGTSALHMSLILAGIERGDHVLVSSFTFAACANVIIYQNAIPVFLDSESSTWNVDPLLLRGYLETASIKPKAIIITHLYGVPAQIDELKSIASEYEIMLIEDAAEAIGAKYHDQSVGQFGDFGVLSFNGNKLITTSGGGALICDETSYKKGLHLATQANSGLREYDHKTVGYNYRLSNILAGLGISQLVRLDEFLEKKNSIWKTYSSALSDWIDFPEEIVNSFSNKWLSVGLMKSSDPIRLIEYLESKNIEARRLWKPLHLHLAYDSYQFIGDGVCEQLFDKGICLPSGAGMSIDDQEYVISTIRDFFTN